MKKLFTLLTVLGLSAGATMMAQGFPDDPGTLNTSVRLYVDYVDMNDEGIGQKRDTISSNVDSIVTVTAREIAGYRFSYWEGGDTARSHTVIMDSTIAIRAIYEEIEYLVKFTNYDGAVLSSGYYTYGNTPAAPEMTPERDATDQYTYVFTGWSPAIAPMTEDMTYVAQYDSVLNSYAIRFLNYYNEGNTLLYEDTLEYGAMPQFVGDDPVREKEIGEVGAQYDLEFTFSGWSPALHAVDGEAEYVAMFDTVYIVKKYTILFVNNNGETVDTLQVSEVEYGQMPSFNGPDPTRPIQNGMQFGFIGWEPEIHAVNGPETYSAQFDGVMIRLNVLVICDNDTMPMEITYGEEATISAAEVEGKHFQKWADGSTEEVRTVTITQDTVFRAIYGSSYVDIDVPANQWTFFCLPQANDVNYWNEDMFELDGLTDVSWGTYNGARRATARSGWETPETYNSLQGYIIWSATAGRLRLAVWPENLYTQALGVDLHAYPAEHADNANWNFVGNPYNRQIGTSEISVTNAQEPTFTYWNGTGYENGELDDQALIFTPLQAFFIQTTGEGTLSFGQQGGGAPRRAQAQVEENSRIDIHTTAGGYTDKSRVIFRSNSSIKYEAGRDASKFVTATAPIQAYLLDVDNVQCAQMVRPAGDDIIRLGFMLREAGDIEIEMPVYADNYELFDSYTGQAYIVGTTVTIYSEAGQYDDRLMLRPVQRVANAIESNAVQGVTTKMIINGQLYLLRDGKLFTVQGTQMQ